MAESTEKVIRLARIGKVITIYYRDELIGKYREGDDTAQAQVIEKVVDHVYRKMEITLREHLTEKLPELIQQLYQPKKGWLSRFFPGL